MCTVWGLITRGTHHCNIPEAILWFLLYVEYHTTADLVCFICCRPCYHSSTHIVKTTGFGWDCYVYTLCVSPVYADTALGASKSLPISGYVSACTNGSLLAQRSSQYCMCLKLYVHTCADSRLRSPLPASVRFTFRWNYCSPSKVSASDC